MNFQNLTFEIGQRLRNGVSSTQDLIRKRKFVKGSPSPPEIPFVKKATANVTVGIDSLLPEPFFPSSRNATPEPFFVSSSNATLSVTRKTKKTSSKNNPVLWGTYTKDSEKRPKKSEGNSRVRPADSSTRDNFAPDQ